MHLSGFCRKVRAGLCGAAEDGDADRFATRRRLSANSADLGQDQVLRALRDLVRESRLVRLGYGVYGRAEISRLSGEPILAARDGFIGAARQALVPSCGDGSVHQRPR